MRSEPFCGSQIPAVIGSLEAIVGIVPRKGAGNATTDFLTGIVVSSTVTEDNSSVEDSIFVSHLPRHLGKMCECCKNGTQQ